jgi:hypothetical protein
MRTLRCITGGIEFATKTSATSAKFRMSIRWAKIRRRVWRDRVNGLDDNRLVKIPKDEKPGHLQNVAAKVEHQHHRRTGTLDKIQNLIRR